MHTYIILISAVSLYYCNREENWRFPFPYKSDSATNVFHAPKINWKQWPTQQQASGAFHLNCRPCWVIQRFSTGRTADKTTANMTCSKNLLVTLCTQIMFSVLVFMCRDPGDTTSKVSCCVETSYCFKNRVIDVIIQVPVALPLKMSFTWKQKYGRS